MKIFVILIICLLLVTTAVVAAEDNCASVLIPTREEASSDLRLAVATLKTMSRAEYEAHKTGAKGSLGIPVADDLITASANYDDFQQRVSQFASAEQYSYNEQDSRTFLKTYLSDESVKAWSQCRLANGGLVVYPRKPSSNGFALRIDWMPPPGVDRASLQIELPQRGFISSPTGDAQSSAHLKVFRELLNSRTSLTFGIVRSSNEDVRVIVNIGGFSDDLLVRPEPPPPSAPQFSFKTYLESGRPIILVMDRLTICEQYSSLVPGGSYTISYSYQKRGWLAEGDHGDGQCPLKNIDRITRDTYTCSAFPELCGDTPEGGKLVIWGGEFDFDDSGAVFRNRVRVGTMLKPN